ncbi:hydroxypyruvate isomerase [Sphingobium sp. B1D7B]|uniref:hydroxypyruvate isomerase family protein n=1 Tax=Sphingobium sp. B1D7B TaxID=2940578 RepID=UPI0022241AF2|nr:TIM barrel protein [Sphingobium sp. B1D7B]MCW2406870.1 hydroxypyruvate isomerase [Sphingobium sp. B1D7B]
MSRLPLCAHLGYLFTELPLQERFSAAAESGFRFIEHPAPYELDAGVFDRLCRDSGLRVVQIALPAGGPTEKGLAALVGREAEFEHGVAVAVRYAQQIGCGLIHPMSGVPQQGVEESATWDCYIRNVRYTCDAAAPAGLTVIIEPIGAGTLAGYFMNEPHKALQALKEVDRSNLAVAFDAYHATQAGVDPTNFTRSFGSLFAHVQIADDPGRHEPGSGAIDFDSLFDALIAVGYAGAVGLEYRPAATTRTGLSWPSQFAQIEPLASANDESVLAR